MNNDKGWFEKKWRPAMGWMYLAVCSFDFLIFPLLNAWFQATFFKGTTFQQWHPLTMEGGGLFHVSMGAIVGVTAWSRGQEKIKVLESLVAAKNGTPVTPTEPPVVK